MSVFQVFTPVTLHSLSQVNQCRIENRRGIPEVDSFIFKRNCKQFYVLNTVFTRKTKLRLQYIMCRFNQVYLPDVLYMVLLCLYCFKSYEERIGIICILDSPKIWKWSKDLNCDCQIRDQTMSFSFSQRTKYIQLNANKCLIVSTLQIVIRLDTSIK